MGCAFDDDDDDDGTAVDASDSVRGGDSDMDRDGAGSWKVSEWWWCCCCCSTTNGDGVAVDELCDEGAMALAAVVVVDDDDDVDGEGPTKNCCKILVRCAVPAPVQSIHPSIHVRRQVVMAVEYPVLVVSGVRIDMKVTR